MNVPCPVSAASARRHAPGLLVVAVAPQTRDDLPRLPGRCSGTVPGRHQVQRQVDAAAGDCLGHHRCSRRERRARHRPDRTCASSSGSRGAAPRRKQAGAAQGVGAGTRRWPPCRRPRGARRGGAEGLRLQLPAASAGSPAPPRHDHQVGRAILPVPAPAGPAPSPPPPFRHVVQRRSRAAVAKTCACLGEVEHLRDEQEDDRVIGQPCSSSLRRTRGVDNLRDGGDRGEPAGQGVLGAAMISAVPSVPVGEQLLDRAALGQGPVRRGESDRRLRLVTSPRSRGRRPAAPDLHALLRPNAAQYDDVTHARGDEALLQGLWW